MGAMHPNDLLRQWASDDVSNEMAIGHMLQHLVKLQASLDSLRETVIQIRTESAIASDLSEARPAPKQKQRSRK